MKYIAFLRGIGPGDPRKSNESLRSVFEKMGFENVRSFISSGNILFESSETDTAKLEKQIEEGFEKHLGISIGTFVRSKEELDAFIATKPFGEMKHSRQTYLTVTFFKKGAKVGKSKDYTYDKKLHAVCAVTNMTLEASPDFMIRLEKAFGKNITTRTYNTLERITSKL